MSYFNHSADTAPFSPTYSFGPTTTGGPVFPGGTPIPFSNPWSVYAPTGYKSPFPPFASPGMYRPLPPLSSFRFSYNRVFPPDFKIGRTQSWNLSIEHQFPTNSVVKVAYVGSQSYNLPLLVDRNPGLYSTNPNLNGLRINPNFSTVLQNGSWGTASYNSLQLSYEQRLSHGLQFASNFTWSKSLDDQSSASAAFNGSVPNPFNFAFNRGVSDFNYPFSFNLYGTYQTPALAGMNGFVRNVFGGWEISGLWHLQSGDPLTIYGGNGNDNSQSHEGADHADYVGGTLNVHQGSKNNWLNEYFNTAAFATNALGTFGNSGRNILQGPGVNNLDSDCSRISHLRNVFGSSSGQRLSMLSTAPCLPIPITQ